MPRQPKPANLQIDYTKHAQDTRVNIPTQELGGFVVREESAPYDMLYPRDPSLDPQLVWKGKDEQDREDLAVPTVPIYIQEKIHPHAIIDALRSNPRAAGPQVDGGEAQLDLFGDFNGLDGADFETRVDFYHHPGHWTNRMILGDSLMVMNSLAEKEGLKGQVQMIYLDPPYGIKFGSNWQVSTRKRQVADKAEDATRQPEQVRAFRDTWQLGIHSYLSYLRDRLVVARELLTETGSVFVQIGDENVHLVRCLLDEVFGAENQVSTITVTKTGSLTGELLSSVADFILWYGKCRERTKYRCLFEDRPERDEADYNADPLKSEGWRAGTTFDYVHGGQVFKCLGSEHWKVTREGLDRLAVADRLVPLKTALRFKRYWQDFPVKERANVWADLGGASDIVYVVQTNRRIVERCVVMTTDPGDLVLDPTCGSGTSAYVAEEWGRRWITIDTSRVALALARTRLMAARYPYFVLADTPEGTAKEAEITGKVPPAYATQGDIKKGFVYKRVPHVKLEHIANNPDIREGMSQDEIDKAILRHAETELLYDQPYEDNKRVRVSGPFTVESLSPHRVLSTPPSPIAPVVPDAAPTPGRSEQGFVPMILDNLRRAGVQNTRRNERLKFETLEPFAGTYLHAKGTYRQVASSGVAPLAADGGPGAAVVSPAPAPYSGGAVMPGQPYAPSGSSPGAADPLMAAEQQTEVLRVAVSIGPEFGTVGAEWIKEAAKEAVRGVGFDLLVVCGFSFDGYVSEEAKQIGDLTVLPVRMNNDLSMGDELLKKTGAGNLFMVFGEPDVRVETQPDGQVTVTVLGLDVYDPTTGQIRSGSTDDLAVWFIDTNYNGESFFVRHAYFLGGDDPYAKLKRALRAEINEEAWSALYRTQSLPFARPETGKIAVKVINHYGDEVMKVYGVG